MTNREYYKKEVFRNPYGNADSLVDRKDIVLSAEQEKAFSTYSDMLKNGGGTGLLYGVTGSGKTQVYLKLIDEAVDLGKDVIVMVPEISLTPQALSIFHKRYGKKVAVFHPARRRRHESPGGGAAGRDPHGHQAHALGAAQSFARRRSGRGGPRVADRRAAAGGPGGRGCGAAGPGRRIIRGSDVLQRRAVGASDPGDEDAASGRHRP